jgi:hypothetical protein
MATASGMPTAAGGELLTCYCCGKSVGASDVVRFHEHPAEGVCAGCAAFLYKRSVAAGRVQRWPWRRARGN